MEVLQNSQKFRVLYGSLTKLTEVPGGYTYVVPVPVPAPRYFTKCRVPGIYPGIYPSFPGIYPTERQGTGMGYFTRTPGIMA